MESSTEPVKEKWNTLTAFSKKEELKERLWNEIAYRYAAPHRYYHNLSRLAFLFSLLEQYLEHIQSPAAVGFAIIYHDIAYDTYQKDNEEQSAQLAEAHLSQLKVSSQLIGLVQELILATKDHKVAPHSPQQNDLQYFIDFDLAILGASPQVYKAYMENIRKEYAKYNDDIYKQGRRQVLQKMVESKHIFNTEIFRNDMEFVARQNIHSELSLL